MQFAMGGGGSGGSCAGGSEASMDQFITSAPLIMAFLPSGHQSILNCNRGGVFEAKIPGLFGNLFEAHGNKGIIGDLIRRLNSGEKPSPPEIGPFSYGENAFPIQGVDVGPAGAVQLSAGFTPGSGGAGASIDI